MFHAVVVFNLHNISVKAEMDQIGSCCVMRWRKSSSESIEESALDDVLCFCFGYNLVHPCTSVRLGDVNAENKIYMATLSIINSLWHYYLIKGYFNTLQYPTQDDRRRRLHSSFNIKKILINIANNVYHSIHVVTHNQLLSVLIPVNFITKDDYKLQK